ncbi:trichohyalin [Bacillus rossius redtenbacheri]|uniref:trichohyalin n=1 Tax=Bacillus rossius redtenbacheri TaxID=93214 RepID=UPI002FDD5DE3
MPDQEQALRDEVLALKDSLRTLRKDAAVAGRAARDHEAGERERRLADLRARLERERDDQLRRQRAALERELSSQMRAELRRRDAQHRGALAAARRKERDLQMRLRDAERQALEASAAASAPCGQCGNYARLQQEAAILKERVQSAESRLEERARAERDQAEETRRTAERHADELSRLRREATLETQRLLDELRAKQRAVTQLERQLHEHASRLQVQADCIQAARSADGSMTSMRDFAKDSCKKGAPRRELESLQRLLESREQEIAALRQATKEKDRKLDQLTSRYRREQMRHYYRQFVELEPVAELEEDSELEDSAASSGSPGPGDGWSKAAAPSYHEELYLELLREHSELQEAYRHAQFDARVLRRLEAELAQARAQARELRRALRDAAAAGRCARGEEAEQAQAQAQAREAALRAENAELREQNELLEFRILEVENAAGRCADVRDASTLTEPQLAAWDPGLLPALEDPLSEVDQGVHDMMSGGPEELRLRLLHAAKSLQRAPDRSCVLQALEALEARRGKHVLLGREQPGRAVATVLPFKEARGETSPRPAAAECLQESGIFEADELEEGVSQATQTEPAATPLGDLRAEIQKLTQIREKIEERGELLPGHQRRTPGDCDTAHECCRKLHDQTSRQHGSQSSLVEELRTMDINKLEEEGLKGRVRELEERERAYQATMLRAEEMMAELQEHCAGLLRGAQRAEADSRRQLAACEEENDRLRWRLDELERGHSALLDRLQRGEEERARLVADAEQLQRDLERCREEVAAPLRAAALQERRSSQALRAQLDDLHLELARTDKEHKEKTNDLKKQLGEAQKTAVDYECTISELREEVDTLEAAVSELGAEVQRRRERERALRAELEAAGAELERGRARAGAGASPGRQPSVQEELVMLDRSLQPPGSPADTCAAQLEPGAAELDSGVEDFPEDASTRRGGGKQAAHRPRRQKLPSPPPRLHAAPSSVREFLQRPPGSALPEDCKRAVRAAVEARRELAHSGLSEAVLHVRSCANCSCVLKSLLSAISEKMRDLSSVMVSKKSEPLALDGADKVPKVKAEVAASAPYTAPTSESVDDSCSEGSPRPDRPRRRLRSPPRQKPQWPQVTTSQWQC